MEYEEESITDATNVPDDTFSHASSRQRENEDAIFTSEKLDKSDEIVDAINKLTINDAIYELNKATASDAQGDLTSNLDTVIHTSNRPDTFTHTSNRILDEKLLSYGTTGKVSAFSPPANPMY